MRGVFSEVDGGRQVLEELLQGLVVEELVPPLRQGLLEMDPEFLAKFHRISEMGDEELTQSMKSGVKHVDCGRRRNNVEEG